MPEEECYVILKYEVTSVLGRTNEPEDYVIDIPFRIFALACDKSDAAEVEIGRGKISRVQVGRAINDRVGLHFAFDSSQSILNAGNTLYDADYSEFKPIVLKQFPNALSCDDLLLIEQIELDDAYRGQRIGLSVVQRIIEDLSGGCGLVVGKPFPLNVSKNDIKGRDKLRKYWERLGWRRIGKSSHWGVCPADVLKIEKDLPRYLQIDRKIPVT